jgi:hypothetical protein
MHSPDVMAISRWSMTILSITNAIPVIVRIVTNADTSRCTVTGTLHFLSLYKEEEEEEEHEHTGTFAV